MKRLYRYLPVTLPSLFIGAFTIQLMLMVQLSHAHLMVAQHGTLNFVDDAVFMVLSLPLSTFDGVDDDGDGKVTMIEFNNHRGSIVDSVGENIVLSDEQGSLSMQGIMLSPVVPHDAQVESISQLTVLARFTLSDLSSALRFHVGIYGKQATQQSLEITATRDSGREKVIFDLTPQVSSHDLFSGGARLL